MANAVLSSGPDVQQPTRPEWVVRDLMRQMGGVHRPAVIARSAALMAVLATLAIGGDSAPLHALSARAAAPGAD